MFCLKRSHFLGGDVGIMIKKQLFKLDMEVEDSTGTSFRHYLILANNLR